MPAQDPNSSKVYFIELNEFNFELLKRLSEHHQYKHLQRLLSFHHTTTFTEDKYESDFLEPWVQWVSIHTGQPSSSHQIKHLGDVPHLHTSQLWESLSKAGKTSGIWGAMNASRGQTENNLFFLPDPWTASEGAYPNELSPLLDLLRYSTKNHLNTSYLTLMQKIGRFLLFLTKKGLLATFQKEIPHLLKYTRQFKKEAFPFISLFDYLSMKLFLKMDKKYKPDFSLIFLNSLAHMQHHHWRRENLPDSKRFEYGLGYLDRAFEAFFKKVKAEDTIIVANALSQKNTQDEEPWILYRQKDQAQFLKAIGIQFKSVESHMTHDAHIFFETEKECQEAAEILREVSHQNEPFFCVETYDEEPKKLFYKILFTKAVEISEKITFNGHSFNFIDLFVPIIERTGKHIQTADVLCNKPIFPKKISNHELFHLILSTCVSETLV